MAINSTLSKSVVRTWKRDNSTNLMGIDDAAANIAQNGRYVRGRIMRTGWSRAKAMLLSGETVQTKLAMFRLSSTY